MGALATFLKVLGKITTIIPLGVQIAELAGRIFRPGEKTGPWKLQIVKQAVLQALEAAEILVGKDIVDQALLDEGITDIANGAVKVMKAVQPKS